MGTANITTVQRPQVNIGAEPGIYQHYKGECYKCLGVAIDPDRAESQIVVYVPLYVTPDNVFGKLVYRSLDGPNGWRSVVNGLPRFRRIADSI